MMQASNKMQKSSSKLPAVKSFEDGLEIYFLTGQEYLYQTLYCIQSLSKVTTTKFKFILVDDGSFTIELENQIQKQLPGAVIVNATLIQKNLENVLPEILFPVLHQKRKVYPHLKKLTDVHTLSSNSDWKLVLDSDMLFWSSPNDIVAWLQHPTQPIYMLDCQQSYGYEEALMQQLSKTAIPKLVNVGVIGLNSKNLNWKGLENWIVELEKAEGTSYYLEQALTAMLIGEQASVILTKQEYQVNPSKQSIDATEGTLHHYVDLSKEGYFKKAWKKI
ncbi:hypothetical protein [Pedobacter sp. MW01-1-1]|uniref:hypothetical protein n=1 Tax=Pedobacter sp. MW01-1-1 TaxID=3383027 RepID=UPI003FEFFF52